MKFLNDIFTEDDNETFCAARVAGLWSIFIFSIIAIVHELNVGISDFSSLGMGFGGLLGGAGVFVGAKQFSTKDQNANP
jgi:hypothetical protein